MKKLIITGTSRTGTTGLTYYLNQDPDVLMLHESGFYSSEKSKVKKLEMNSFFQDMLEQKHVDFHRVMCAYPRHMNDEFCSYKIFGDKYPDYINCLHLIPYDVHIIYCIRDPRSCILSKMKYFKMSLEKAIKEYNKECSKIPEDSFIVKYEDAVTNIELLKNNLESFLDEKLNIDNKIYEPINIDRWKNYPSISKRIWSETKIIRERFGYVNED